MILQFSLGREIVFFYKLWLGVYWQFCNIWYFEFYKDRFFMCLVFYIVIGVGGQGSFSYFRCKWRVLMVFFGEFYLSEGMDCG